ncbi:transposase [Geobacter pelophilus]|uniref:Transposase n=1 Tax=Geoanaerobacter pelophilus TaxID=60036 RepID=A0AAW4L7V7_9BACT|nr:transposase [Geoanaerobacter pelophilus]MBT0663311.1 transposase [Geoanaerobacter pelophilus]
MIFNRDIHHRRSIRLKNYDYSQSGAYFVTICAWQRECLFGEIVDGKMLLNDFGRVVVDSWNWLASQYDYVALEGSVVMPNHLHGIIVINNVGAVREPLLHAEKTKSLGRLIGAFKTVSTKQINIIRNNPGCTVWQRNYYERVIRNEDELTRAQEYIINNPLKWEFDKENPACQ